MSNIVRTWEEEAISAEEIELTDAQLVAVFGAWDEDNGSNSSDCSSSGDDCHRQFHKKFEKRVKLHLEFDFDASKKREESRENFD